MKWNLEIHAEKHDVFTDMPGETDLIQHRVEVTDNTPTRCKPYPLW